MFLVVDESPLSDYEITPDDIVVSGVGDIEILSICEPVITYNEVNEDYEYRINFTYNGYYIEWTADNGNFNYSANGDTCRIDPNKSGSTTFTATVYDAQGNAVSKDEQTMTSKAGFFDKIIAFFEKLFGLTKVIPQAFKGVL